MKNENNVGWDGELAILLSRERLVLVLMALLGIVVGIVIGFWLDKETVEDLTEKRMGGGYQFINPLLECDSNLGERNVKLKNMENIIKDYIDKKQAMGKVDEVALYFRDLNNGPWMGINESEKFIVASLLKLPMAMIVTKKGEENVGLLDTLVEYKEDKKNNDYQTFDVSLKMKVGSKYTLDQLIERMLVNSDNEAVVLIRKYITDEELASFFKDLGVDASVESRYDIGVKEYGAFFRILYNSSYLSRANSEKILKLLSNARYSYGLKKGLPEGVVLSHKFGEMLVEGSGQLHDCGVVYKEKSPYLICVMSRGADQEELEKVIADISKKIYMLSE